MTNDDRRTNGPRHENLDREATMWLQIVIILVLAALLVLGGLVRAQAHDQWADGSPVPDWIKKSCCGPADAHRLTPEQVHRVSEDYYEVDGYKAQIPVKQALPSQDGQYWIFYRDLDSGGQSGVYCFFVPMSF